MITRPLLFMISCFGVIVLLQSFAPEAMAMDIASDINQLMLEDHRTRKRKNYILQLAKDHDRLGTFNNVGVSYETEPFESNTNPDELSALMVDYANMIRNDVILLDNSVETRTRKRGNIKVEKKYNQAIPDPPCSCEYNKEMKDFGEYSFPRFVETRNCSKEQQGCTPPYVCTENLYNIIILKKRLYASSHQETLELPRDIRSRWIAEKRPVSVGCVCTNEFLVKPDGSTDR